LISQTAEVKPDHGSRGDLSLGGIVLHRWTGSPGAGERESAEVRGGV